MGELLDTVVTAHGGLDRWNAVRSIDATFNFSGGLLNLKGFPGHHRPTVRARLHERGGPVMRWTINVAQTGSLAH